MVPDKTRELMRGKHTQNIFYKKQIYFQQKKEEKRDKSEIFYSKWIYGMAEKHSENWPKVKGYWAAGLLDQDYLLLYFHYFIIYRKTKQCWATCREQTPTDSEGQMNSQVPKIWVLQHSSLRVQSEIP